MLLIPAAVSIAFSSVPKVSDSIAPTVDESRLKLVIWLPRKEL